MTQTDLAGLRAKATKGPWADVEFGDIPEIAKFYDKDDAAFVRALVNAFDRGELVEAHQSQSESNQRQNREPGHLDSRTDGVASRRDTPRSVIHPAVDEMQPANVSIGVTAGETAPNDRPRSEPAGGAALGDVGKRIHRLKIWPAFFDDVENGRKPFEYRRNDRDYRVGDVLRLREWSPETELYTGRETTKTVTYVLTGGQTFPLPDGYAILGLERQCGVASINAELVEVLKEIKIACRRAAHPAAPIVLSERHVTHLNDIADKCDAALSRAQSAPAEPTREWPQDWKVSVHESDGRTWLSIDGPDCDASLSCQTNNDNGETIQSQVAKAFVAALTEDE